ncbi:MAG: rhomboid family intramembrane serine protease [Fibromonadaceae bacterium]|jgi:membrane associated rhomboid family serine protease|nr:rhomboid family intramembrane serine protease [Fibromonadaceae bacterium]
MLGLTPFKYLPRPMQAILLANAVVYLLSWVGAGNYLLWYGAFIPSRTHELWRFLSYAFVHFDFMHILFNMLMFWMFATEVCKTLGEKNFTALYLASAVFAGVFGIPFYAFGLMGNNPIIGASGALFGVMAAYAFLFPERIILMFFIIPMKIKHAIWIFIAIDLFMARSNDGIAHFTHLGGVLSGYLFMLFWSKNISLKSLFTKPKQQDTYSREFFKEQAQRNKPSRPLEGEVHKGRANAKEERLNEILEKINRSGLQSLSQEERDYLQWLGQQNKKRM